MKLLNHKKTILTTQFYTVCVCLMLLVLRICWTGNISHIYLAWNLFLAWIPLGIALFVDACKHKIKISLGFILLPVLAIWLLFFPNAPYLITDLIHLNNRYDVHYWFDLILIFWFAYAGISAGILSLYWIHQAVKHFYGKIYGWITVLTSSFLAGYGVYLGRILRWNSWDIFLEPGVLLKESIYQIQDFTAQTITLVFGLLLLSVYFLFISLIQFKQESISHEG